jgi:SAM-dependent methyltransferase
MTSLADYYERRAPDYDAVYAKPERQADLGRLQALLPPLFADRSVLEVAAGTGYWTQFLAPVAREVYATDYNAAPLAIARSRSYPRGNVRFGRADAFALSGSFDAAFVGFWWSHMMLGDVDRFLAGLCSCLRPGSVAAIVDNRYVEGSNYPITRTDNSGNTYQQRSLPDGSTYEVLKNFPTAAELVAIASRHGSGADVVELDYYWMLTLTT